MEAAEEIEFIKKSIQRALKDLPALPVVVTRVLAETERPDACANSIENLISTDQALTSKVLRVVNSAYYGLSGQVTSLSQAVVILGMQQIRNLVLSVSAISAMQPRTARQHETLKQFWLHAFGTAAATQLIAHKKMLNARDAEAAFVGGLLHDIGRLFLFTNFTQTYDEVIAHADEHGATIEEAENLLLGMDHGQVGEAMARHWRLPELLITLIAHHEGPFNEGTSPMQLAVHVGDYMTKYLYFEQNPGIEARIDPIAQEWLNFNDEDFAWLRETTQNKVDEASQVFGLLAA